MEAITEAVGTHPYLTMAIVIICAVIMIWIFDRMADGANKREFDKFKKNRELEQAMKKIRNFQDGEK